jgi:hypothetical protein
MATFSAFRTAPQTIPAGAVLKRLLVKDCRIQGEATKIAYDNLPGLGMNIIAELTGGSYGVKTLYSTWRMIPRRVTSLYDVATAQRVYTAYFDGGDLEIGFSQEVNYGGPGKSVPFQWRYRTETAGPTTPIVTLLSTQLSFCSLYYL